jgi:hypothetical protein
MKKNVKSLELDHLKLAGQLDGPNVVELGGVLARHHIVVRNVDTHFALAGLNL